MFAPEESRLVILDRYQMITPQWNRVSGQLRLEIQRCALWEDCQNVLMGSKVDILIAHQHSLPHGDPIYLASLREQHPDLGLILVLEKRDFNQFWDALYTLDLEHILTVTSADHEVALLLDKALMMRWHKQGVTKLERQITELLTEKEHWQNTQQQDKLQRVHQSVDFVLPIIAHCCHTTVAHYRSISTLSYKLAEFLGFPQEDCNIISQAALVQDLGLLAMPESMRQHGGPPPLEQTQLSLFHQHPMIAYHWLQEHNFPLLLAQIVRQRHEHYDGKGYPDGLNGEQIILGAGIVAVATAFENMLTGTIDKEITASVCERLKSMVGTRFASLPVEALENITQKM